MYVCNLDIFLAGCSLYIHGVLLGRLTSKELSSFVCLKRIIEGIEWLSAFVDVGEVIKPVEVAKEKLGDKVRVPDM